MLEYNGEEIELSSDLPPKVGRTPVGESARLTVLRGGDEIELDVEIGELPEDGRTSRSKPRGQMDGNAGALGLTVEPLTPENARAAGVESGVLVTSVERGPALKAGIRTRDIITEINRKPVGSLKAFRAVVESLSDGQAVSVRVVRQGRPIYLVMRP